MIDLGEGVVPSRTRFPRPAATKTADDLRKAPGTARSLSQRVRSTSSAAELESARRRLARTRAGATKGPGARPINPKDVADRYRGKTAGKRMGETQGANGHASKLPMLSDKRAGTAKATRADDAVRTEARIRAARQKNAASTEVRVREARISKSRQDASDNARIKKARQSYAQRVADGRKSAAKPVNGRPVKGEGKPSDANQGPGARPIKSGGGAVRPIGTKPVGTKPDATKPGGSVRPSDGRPGGTRPVSDGGTRPVDGRPIRPGSGDVRPVGGSYSGPKDGVRPGAITAGGEGVRPGGGAVTGGGLTAGSGGRPPITAIGSVNRPDSRSGGGYGGYGSYGGGFNSHYGYDPYYNNCFWNQWGSSYPNAWCSWFWSPFYATGYCWQNYWLYGGSWGYGRRRYSSYSNYLWLGPFIPQTSSFIVYDDPEPEVIYVQVPGDQAVAGEELLYEGEAAINPGSRPRVDLAPEATNPKLQRELNRAAGYYLTQGDRAFRETRYGDAAHFYAKAVEYSSDSGILYLVLSDALFATGDYRYAAYALRQAFEREPELALNVIDKRDFYADPTDFDRQLETLEGYVEDHVLDMDARLVLSANYLFGGRAGDALALMENPFSEELRSSKEGALMEESARRIVYGDETEIEELPSEMEAASTDKENSEL